MSEVTCGAVFDGKVCGQPEHDPEGFGVHTVCANDPSGFCGEAMCHPFVPASSATVATFDAIQAVENGICTDDDLKTVLALRTVHVEIEGRHYSLALLSSAIQAAWRYAMHRGGPDWALEDLEWREKNGI